jgi:hypothetical protein
VARISTVAPEEAQGLRKLVVRLLRRQTGGWFPGSFRSSCPTCRLLSPRAGSTATSTNARDRR